jgi:hypothetical protein
MVELVHLVSRLQEENRQLAGQVGFLEARRQTLEEQLRLLAAPATTVTPSGGSVDSVAPTTPDRTVESVAPVATVSPIDVQTESAAPRPESGARGPRRWLRRVGTWLSRM